MIESERGYADVAALIDFMAKAVESIASSELPINASISSRLRAAYESRLPALQAAMLDFDARRAATLGEPAPLVAPRQDERQPIGDAVRNAQLHIVSTEHTLTRLQTHIEVLTRSRPINQRELTAFREDLALHAELLGEWEAILGELVVVMGTDSSIPEQ